MTMLSVICYGIITSLHSLGWWGYYVIRFRKAHYPVKLLLNLWLMIPVLSAYQQLVQNPKNSDFLLSIDFTFLLLLQDMIMDEKVGDNLRYSREFSSSYKYYKKILTASQRDLLKRLSVSQGAQLDSASDADRIEFVTREKGLWFPVSVTFSSPDVSEEEIEILQDIGYWYKCIDDFIDKDEDERQHNVTLFTHCSHGKEYLDRIASKVAVSVQSLEYPPQSVKTFTKKLIILAHVFEIYPRFTAKLPRSIVSFAERSFLLTLLLYGLAALSGVHYIATLTKDV